MEVLRLEKERERERERVRERNCWYFEHIISHMNPGDYGFCPRVSLGQPPPLCI